MTKHTHTPGPWSVDDYGAGQRIVVKGRPGFSGDYRIADAHFSSDLANCVRVGEMQANARLIAAAPDLLDVVRELIGALRTDKSIVRNPAFESDDAAWILEHAEAALARATSPTA